MLFNSYAFILAFLPVAAFGFFAAGQFGRQAALSWLLACSLFFYSYWDPIYLPLLLFSIAFNFTAGTWLMRLAERNASARRVVLGAAIATNLAMLGFFKYANFFVDNVTAATGGEWELAAIILPLGISFYTFQQIAYLVDTARGEIRIRSVLDYATTVSFFPHLIAGPIILYREILPQFAARAVTRFDQANFALGVTLFVAGLAKKVLIADWMATYATPVFDAAATGTPPTLIEAWGGALAYTLQLYFDFSGYSDMAVGLGLMFNIRLPVNFNSPYKAVNIVDFWRRWHITLSYFLRHYIYIALGGNRLGPARRHVNLIATMILAGLWHGAGWTFVVWGTYHGILLSVNRLWQWLRGALGSPVQESPSPLGAWIGRAVTLLAVIVGWVIFRAGSFDSAWMVLRGMLGMNGIRLPDFFLPIFPASLPTLMDFGVTFGRTDLFFGVPQTVSTIVLFAIVLLAPNTQQLFGYRQTVDDGEPCPIPIVASRPAPLPVPWAPTRGWAVVMAFVFVYALTQMSDVSEFLYFQF
jgi:D-alanyl-lipoteichoic acid acyltransferase DltB (MBOAT superfamily)